MQVGADGDNKLVRASTPGVVNMREDKLLWLEWSGRHMALGTV
jgi:hypothetical protein